MHVQSQQERHYLIVHGQYLQLLIIRFEQVVAHRARIKLMQVSAFERIKPFLQMSQISGNLFQQ